MAKEINQIISRGYQFALACTNDPNVAQDLVQEALFRILKSRKPLNIKYLIVTIKNLNVDRIRRNKTISFASIENLNGNQIPKQKPDSIPDPALHKAISELRPIEREFLYLSIVEGYTARELGEIYSKQRGSVLSIIHRAKAKIRKKLTDPFLIKK